MHLNNCLTTTTNSTVTLQNVYVYWRFENLVQDEQVVLTKKDKAQTVFQKGYWSFDDLAQRFREEGFSLKAQRFNNTCVIHTEDVQVDLGSVGLLIGLKRINSFP